MPPRRNSDFNFKIEFIADVITNCSKSMNEINFARRDENSIYKKVIFL